ncbi:DUF4982 domain-containing protein [Carboxylicivirga sediminis]|uniref:DUF4982 domain-containing protein n=2 Tax=Carboxylicivirga sediminis TaxID=2006564 RepID=A0A941EYK6_9BACT|nr:DUF4982 domain-containing protein [Carboxylicivirga sediminis]
MKKTWLFLVICLTSYVALGQTVRERINFDDDWYFAYGHPFDKTKDYHTGTSYFTYLAKARYGADGAAAADFDHRAWRPVNLPHDWAVEVPFDAKASHSHGYKAVGPGFPETSVGWYRKIFFIDSTQLGHQIFLDFDGVSRDSKVWVNGHYLGNEPSGYQSFSYNISDIINYGADNVVAVRADVSMEEGWYYEGAGIYRHVWLRTTPALHIPKDGLFVHSEVTDSHAQVFIETEVDNKGDAEQHFSVRHRVLDAAGNMVVQSADETAALLPMDNALLKTRVQVEAPQLWGLDTPYMYQLVTEIWADGQLIDQYQTSFGIRTIYFDADKGFFLNGKHAKLKGTNNHQDHAGVGCAMPDELIRWRLQQLKNMGSNAIRSSHNPPTPELLDLCDEMGILVINENRLMGTTNKALYELERLIKRDRNHPSVIVWSIGNEEWGIEWNEIGARMTQTMQNFARRVDPTRPVNVAISGGWGQGSSTTVEIMGYNYLVHGDTDEHHKNFPHQPSIGTEEGSTFATRGVYFEDNERQYKVAYDVKPRPGWFTIQEGWKHYAERDYLSGMFIWTGFDYRGESTPYTWPSVTSYFGMMDVCGFPKDNVFYLKSWWQDEPVLHLLPHWNWQGKEGDTIDVWVYSNCQELELLLNEQSLGTKTMPLNGHLSWKVPYAPGTIKAIGYNNGEHVLTKAHTSTGAPQQINLKAHQTVLKEQNDLAVITVEVHDEKGLHVPTANNLIEFEIDGPGKIIGLGNGNPTSHEKEVFIDNYQQIELPETSLYSLTDAKLARQLTVLDKKEQKYIKQLEAEKALVTEFVLAEMPNENQIYTWYYIHVGQKQRVYLNGHLLSAQLSANDKHASFVIDNSLLKKGTNHVLLITQPFEPQNEWDKPNRKAGVIQVITESELPNRQLFNGLAQVLVQSTGEPGQITLKAKSEGLQEGAICLDVVP